MHCTYTGIHWWAIVTFWSEFCWVVFVSQTATRFSPFPHWQRFTRLCVCESYKLNILTASCLHAPQVEDSRIARLIDGRILIGRDLGITTIQVCSTHALPLSSSSLCFCHFLLYLDGKCQTKPQCITFNWTEEVNIYHLPKLWWKCKEASANKV